MLSSKRRECTRRARRVFYGRLATADIHGPNRKSDLFAGVLGVRKAGERG